MTTIGASVLDERQQQQPQLQHHPWRSASTEFASSASGSQQQLNVQTYYDSKHGRHLCFSEPLRPALPSLLRAVVAQHQHQQQQQQQRLLLLQPSSSRQDHSLAMDWAISLASAEPCRCHRWGRPGSNSSHGSWRSHYSSADDGDTSAAAAAAAETDPSVPIRCENCVAVTLIVPAAAIGTHPQPPLLDACHDIFPLLCRPYEQGTDSHFPLTLDLNEQRREASFQRRQQQALQRVQVRHVTTLQDVWEYLLQLPGLPVDQQPVGGVFLCGLDALIEPLQLHAHDPALATIRLTQTVAILMDTVACMERTFGRPPAVAVTLQSQSSPSTSESNSTTTTTSSSSSSSVDSWFRAASNFWSPVVLRVVPANDDSSSSSDHHGIPTKALLLRTRHSDPDEVAVSHWIVQGGTATAWYAVLQNLDHEQRIVWGTDDDK